jgi:RNA polymerase sigma factor (sigma-70 family)
MIDALKRGDLFAFQQIYTQYSNKVYSYFKRKTNSDEDACDLLQTTFLKLWQYRKSLSDDYLLEQHLFHISKTVFIDYLRKQNKRSYLQKEMLAKAAVADYSNPAASFSVASQLSAALALMPDVRRRVFELNRLHGYSYKEIAELLSISVKAVDNNLSKALKELRRQFVSIIPFLLLFLFM